MLGLLVGPHHLGHRRRAGRRRPARRAGVMPGRLQDLLVPDIEPGRDVPDRLRQRQCGAILRHHAGQLGRGPGRQQAMVVVDEVHVAVVDPLVIRHVRVGRVDAHRLADHLGHRPALPHQIVIDVARALLVARQDAILELCVKRLRLRGVADRGLCVAGHWLTASCCQTNALRPHGAARTAFTITSA